MHIQKVLKWVVIGCVFAVPFIPLVIANSMFFPFITGKNFAFRFLVEVMAAGWLVLALSYSEYRPRKTLLLGAFALFVLIIGLADVFGENPLKSLWSNYERMEGWVTLAHLFAYFVVLASILQSETMWRRLMHTTIGASVLVGCYGLLQLAGLATINQGGIRLDATFGNATYLAIYMLFHIFFTAVMWERYWKENTATRFGMSFVYGGIILLQVFILFFTATRGSILGLLGGVLLAAVLFAWTHRHARNTAFKVSCAAIASVVLLVGGFMLVRGSSFVEKSEPLRRLASISFSDGTVSSRFLNYQMAWQGFKENPILGWGQENYNLVFNKYYDPKMYAQEPWFDRVHNIFFDWLIAGGLLGLLSYLFLFGAALWGLWRSGAFDAFEQSMFTGLLAGYFFHNLFVFDNITSYILFVLFLGFVASRIIAAREAPVLWNGAVLPAAYLPITAVLSVGVLWGVAWMANQKAFAANLELIQSISPRPALTDNLASFKKAISYNSSVGNQEIREQLIQGATRLAGAQIPPEIKGELFTLAQTEMEKQMVQSPKDARFPFFLAIMNDAYGRNDEGKKYIELAHELSPGKQAILFQLGMNARLRNDQNAALAAFEKAYRLEPSFKDARIFYALSLIEYNKSAQAAEILEPLIAEGEAGDDRIVRAYVSKRDFATVARIWAGVVATHPKDLQARYALAAAHFAQGNKDQAIKVLEGALVDIPEGAVQTQNLIQQIKAGTIKLTE